MPLVRGVPDWALYAGGGVVVGGGYLLYRKRKGSAAPAATTVTPSSAGAAAGQQSSIVPYYLTGNQYRQTAGGGDIVTTGPPLPTPSGPPQGVTAEPIGGGLLPAIPPILPPAPTTPVAPSPAPPSPAPSPPPAPAPAPSRPVSITNLAPADLQRINAAGESIIKGLYDPSSGGTWWLGSKGGVFTAGGSPFYGSARNYGFDDPNVRRAVDIVPNARGGYSVVSSRGENYDFFKT